MCDGCEVNQKYYRYTITEPTKEDILLDSLCIPTQTQVRDQLGSKLADVFFENLSSEARILLGLQPPLTGPQAVWINPKSRLANNVRCKAVPEPQVLYHKAFSHQAILELGEKFIKSLEFKMKKEIEESLKQHTSMLEEECNKRLLIGLQKAKTEADEHCRQVVGTLMEHFDRCFAEVVNTCKLRMRKECQFRIQEERADLAAYMLMQLEEEVEKRDLELCADFHDILYGELNALERKYVRQIDSERQVAEDVLKDVIHQYETKLVDLRSEMEICSLVDICRAINEERGRQEQEARGVEAETKKQIKLLMDLINDLKENNKTLQEMATERAKRISQYEEKMRRIIEEFQKFINFALKAVPAQAEFLLSMQKMIMTRHYQDTLLEPEDYKKFKNCVSGKIDQVPSEEPTPEEKETKPSAPESPTPKSEDSSKYAFDYYKFKYNLLKKFVKGIKFEKEDKKPEPKPCTKKHPRVKVTHREESTKEMEEYREALTIVGEQAREHMQPVKTFLQQRAKTMAELCRDDPEMAKMILGRQQTFPAGRLSS